MKGVSPLIAAVMLIVVSMTIATIIYGSLSTTIRSSTAITSNTSAKTVECTSASVSIQDVFISGSSSSSTVRAIVKNSGYTDDLVVQDGQVFNKTGSNFSTPDTPVTNFDRGNIVTLTFSNVSFSSASCPNAFSKVIVTTNCGGISNVFDGTPKCS